MATPGELFGLGQRPKRIRRMHSLSALLAGTSVEGTTKRFVHRRCSSMGKGNEEMNFGFTSNLSNVELMIRDFASRFEIIPSTEDKLQQLIPLPLESEQGISSIDGEDEDIWTTPEWLKVRDYVEKIRVEMTQNKANSDQDVKEDEAGQYTYRIHGLDGARDESPNIRFGQRTFPSRRSMASQHSEEEGEWSRADLLYHSDRIRHIARCHSISDEDLAPALLIFSKLLIDERDPERMISLEAVAYARLDKLMATIFDEEQEIVRPSPLFTKAYLDALALRSRWQERFGLSYERIDDVRLQHLKTCGAFHDVEVNPYSDDIETLYIVKRYKPTGTYMEMDKRFKAGDWWLNGTCAYRDGITGSATEILSECRYGVLTLCLLDGMEDSEENDRISFYTITGTFDCVPRELIKLNFGKPIRLLRGPGLTSKWAPRGGLRYDGLYTLKVFGTKYHGDNVWTWNLTLQQLDKEPDLVEVLHIPSPSQLDDWKLCNEMVEATLESARADVAAVEALRDRASTPEWEEQLTQLSKRLSDATDDIRADVV